MASLILPAQYERWTLPLTVAIAGPFSGLGGSRDGAPPRPAQRHLAAKNAILIVDFAALNRQEGMNAADAAMNAAANILALS